jgi:intracellular sulfur oxidation DsrE/DsrF family protein
MQIKGDNMVRKNVLSIVLIVVFLSVGLAGCATTGSDGPKDRGGAVSEPEVKAAFGVRKPKHVGVALMSARTMLSGEAEQHADEVVIVACGPAIRALAAGGKFDDRVQSAIDRGVQLKACGVTIERMGFDATRFVEGVEVVPNGFVELVRLQESGYHSIEL